MTVNGIMIIPQPNFQPDYKKASKHAAIATISCIGNYALKASSLAWGVVAGCYPACISINAFHRLCGMIELCSCEIGQEILTGALNNCFCYPYRHRELDVFIDHPARIEETCCLDMMNILHYHGWELEMLSKNHWEEGCKYLNPELPSIPAELRDETVLR